MTNAVRPPARVGPRVLLVILGLTLSLFARSGVAREQEAWFSDAAGKKRSFAAAYDTWFGDGRYRSRFVRALAENAAIMSVELAVYWFDPGSSVVDWQYPNLLDKLSRREAFRFDDNLTRTNYLFHPGAGASHYWFSRVNGLGIPASWAFAQASSALYELVFEWREVASINDLIVTPNGGMSAGEFFYQLGEYVNSEPPRSRRYVGRSDWGGLWRQVGRQTVGLPRLGHLYDTPADHSPLPPDNLGLSSAYAHQFRVAVAQRAVRVAPARFTEEYALTGHFEIAAMPGFARPGAFSTWFLNGNFTSFDFNTASGRDVAETDIAFDSHLVGYFSQRLTHHAEGLQGLAREYALGSKLRYVDRNISGARDQYGIVHLLHPLTRYWLHAGALRATLGAAVSPDFASVRSLAYAPFVARFGADGTKSSLLRHEYFHAWGLSAMLDGSLSLESVTLGGSASYGRFESIDGLERFQEDVTRETHAVDRIFELSAYLAIEPGATGVSARFELSSVGHASDLGGFAVTRTREGAGVALGTRF